MAVLGREPETIAGRVGGEAEALLLRFLVASLDLAVLGRFYFRSREHNPSLIPLQQMVVVPRLPVVTQYFDLWLHGGSLLY